MGYVERGYIWREFLNLLHELNDGVASILQMHVLELDVVRDAVRIAAQVAMTVIDEEHLVQNGMVHLFVFREQQHAHQTAHLQTQGDHRSDHHWVRLLRLSLYVLEVVVIEHEHGEEDGE